MLLSTLGCLVVVSHFETSSLEATLDIKSLIRLAAVKNTLVAAHLLSHEIQSLNHLQPELLSLLVLGDSDIFDVAYNTEVMNAILY